MPSPMAPTIGIDIRVLGTGRTTGVEVYTEQLLEHLVPLAPGVQFKLFYAGRRPLVRLPWMEGPNVHITHSPLPNRLLWARTRLTGRPYLDHMVGGADVFFFPHFLVGATSPYCRRVLTMHDLSFERYPELFSFSRRFWHRFQMQPRLQAARADRVIAVSESTRRDLVGLYGIDPAGIVAIPSGIQAGLVRPGPEVIESFRARHGLPGRFILMLGTLEPRKNFEAVIGALERLPHSMDDVHLVIAGPAGWLGQGIRSRARSSACAGRIRFIEPVTHAERAALLGAASLLAYPSLMEGFGFPPLEALACGTPAVVGANSAMLQVGGDAVVAVDPYSVTDLAAAFISLLTDSRFREHLLERGTQVVSRHAWSGCAERTLREIFSTLEVARRPVQ